MTKKKRSWQEDDNVIVLISGETYRGTIVEVGKRKCQVLFEDGDDLEIATHRLMPYESDDPLDNIDVKNRNQESNVGFNQFNIHWDKHTINFKFQACGGMFFGWWRKCHMESDKKAFAIDIHVKHKHDRFNVDSIIYYDDDPREDLYSLESDICAACNKWFFHKCNGNWDTIDSLLLKANQPTLVIHSISAFDMMLLELKQFRDSAIRTGARRTLILDPEDVINKPKHGVRIEIDFSAQAKGLKGRVPALYTGGMLDTVTTKEGQKKGAHKKGKKQPINKAASGTIDQLVKQLQNSTDKVEKRKLRAALRKMGHKGGARSNK